MATETSICGPDAGCGGLIALGIGLLTMIAILIIVVVGTRRLDRLAVGQSARYVVSTDRAEWMVEVLATDEGFSVGCPALPGCFSQGDTLAEALVNIRDAIQEYLAAQ